jgi:cytidylate kinase
VEAVLANNYQRVDNDRQRYQQYFNIDAYDLANYDEVVDTTKLDLEQVVAKVIQLVRQRLTQE